MTYKEFFKGKMVEKIFKETLEDILKQECFESNKEEDTKEHWDIGVNLKFDVKGLRKINRGDSTTDENIHWVEIKNVNGDNGWLYGESTHFAFELNDYWLIVEKIKLQDLIKYKCKDKIKCDKPTLYQLYTRENRKDIITLVKTIDLMCIKDFLIEKK